MYIMGKEEVEAVQQVIESGQLFRYQPGVESITDKLEKELSQRFGVNHAIALSSGTASLITALAGMGIGPGDEVIVPAYTFMATALAPLAVGAVPVLAEIDQSLTIDPSNAEKKITPNTKAIIPVHMCGLSCDMTAIMQLAQKHNLLVLEDAAQACGGSYQGQALGTIGDVGAFSFNSHKIISCGEGGAIITNQVEFFQRALIHHDGGCAFRDHKLDIPFFAGLNFRTQDILIALFRVQFCRLDGILAAVRAEES
ncbi:MAG: DegT/DnrJ/EryC1/StrS family aminotransferase [Hyphomicrobiales bacterium]|nr:DegT/DnrJ/EryC1/StrS family aminotransferase [Hyphomicrobiales bacterium]